MNDLLIKPMNPAVISVHDQIASLNEQYMRMLLIMSIFLFLYTAIVFLSNGNPKYKRLERVASGIAVVAGAFTMTISIIYFTGWM